MSVICGLSVAQSIEHLQTIYAKKTLGQFLELVRQKIGIKESFDGFMDDYIKQRNFIIHNISRTSRFSIYTKEGRLELAGFLTDFKYKNRKVKLTFMALTEAWLRLVSSKEELGLKFKEFRETDLYREIEIEFMPQLSTIFGKKSS